MATLAGTNIPVQGGFTYLITTLLLVSKERIIQLEGKEWNKEPATGQGQRSPTTTKTPPAQLGQSGGTKRASGIMGAEGAGQGPRILGVLILNKRKVLCD